MTDSAIAAMSTDQLVALFIELGIAQGHANDFYDTDEYNRLFVQMTALEEELRSRRGDARRALIALYDHPNLQVSLMAAKATLAVAPEAARKVLEAIKATHYLPQSMDASSCLGNLDSGFFKPI